jgi:hypothetical protein
MFSTSAARIITQIHRQVMLSDGGIEVYSVLLYHSFKCWESFLGFPSTHNSSMSYFQRVRCGWNWQEKKQRFIARAARFIRHFSYWRASFWHAINFSCYVKCIRILKGTLQQSLRAKGTKEFWMDDQTYMESYMAWNGVLPNCCKESQNRETTTFQNLTTLYSLQLIFVEGPIWVGWEWNSIWLRAHSRMS